AAAIKLLKGGGRFNHRLVHFLKLNTVFGVSILMCLPAAKTFDLARDESKSIIMNPPSPKSMRIVTSSGKDSPKSIMLEAAQAPAVVPSSLNVSSPLTPRSYTCLEVRNTRRYWMA